MTNDQFRIFPLIWTLLALVLCVWLVWHVGRPWW